jgi:hypothetical protein
MLGLGGAMAAGYVVTHPQTVQRAMHAATGMRDKLPMGNGHRNHRTR